MSSIIVILVVIAAALVIASGAWVATALIRTLTPIAGVRVPLKVDVSVGWKWGALKRWERGR